MSISIGVIGAGAMGASHATTINTEVAGAVVGSVFDRDHARAQLVAEATGARIADDVDSLIAESDAVVVASPDSTHPELALACISAGKMVLCEKPLAITPEEAWRVVQAEVEAGRRFVQVGFMRRFDAGFRQLKTSIGSGAVGEPVVVHAHHRNASSSTSTSDEGIITGSMIHELDTIPWLLDSPATAIRVESPRAEGLKDPQLAWITLASGAMSTVEVFVNARYGYDVTCAVVGSEGMAELPHRPQVSVRRNGTHSSPIGDDFVGHFADAYRVQMQSWARSVELGEASGPSAWDGYAATLVAESGVLSMKSETRRDIVYPARPDLYAR